MRSVSEPKKNLKIPTSCVSLSKVGSASLRAGAGNPSSVTGCWNGGVQWVAVVSGSARMVELVAWTRCGFFSQTKMKGPLQPP